MPLPTSFSVQELAALREVLNSRSPASKMRYRYTVGDIDLTPFVIEAEWGRPDAEAPGIEFTGRFKAAMPSDIRNETMIVDLTVATSEGNLTFRRYTGRIRTVVTRRGYTEIEAASGGYWLDKVRFDEDAVSYVDVAPSEIIWDVVSRAAAAGVYNLGYADIEPIDGPKVRREEFLAITRIDKLSRPIAAAVEEAELFFRDSPFNSPLCHRDRGPAEATEVLHEYIVGRHIAPEDFDSEATSDDYYDVVIYTISSLDGKVSYLTDPILVPGSTAPLGVGYEIAVSDESATSAEDAYALATKVAQRLVHGETTTAFSTKFPHPLMVDGDFISIPERFDDGLTSGVRYWIAEVEVQMEHHDLTHDFEVTMVRRREETDAVPEVAALPAPTKRGS